MFICGLGVPAWNLFLYFQSYLHYSMMTLVVILKVLLIGIISYYAALGVWSEYKRKQYEKHTRFVADIYVSNGSVKARCTVHYGTKSGVLEDAAACFAAKKFEEVWRNSNADEVGKEFIDYVDAIIGRDKK